MGKYLIIKLWSRGRRQQLVKACLDHEVQSYWIRDKPDPRSREVEKCQQVHHSQMSEVLGAVAFGNTPDLYLEEHHILKEGHRLDIKAGPGSCSKLRVPD